MRISEWSSDVCSSDLGKASAEWIRDSWAALAAGRSDVTTELFTACATCSTQPSVVLTIEGTTLREEVVVLGAPLDSINAYGGGSPGQARSEERRVGKESVSKCRSRGSQDQ